MIRHHTTFLCHGMHLVGTLDGNPLSTKGLLLVSGGNETRCGAWNGQARMAEHLSDAGFAVFRFDRRGVGDSEGANTGFRHAGDDIAAALQAFRELCPMLNHVAGLGNCDAASALMLTKGKGMDALILSNPWTYEDDSVGLTVEDARRHYRSRLADPAAIRRLLTGKVSLGKLARSLVMAGKPRPLRSENPLLEAMRQGISHFSGEIRFPIAGRDRTGQAFLSLWDKADPRIRICPDATHSYVEPGAFKWYLAQATDMLRQPLK